MGAEQNVAVGDKVVTRFTLPGTHHGTFLGVAPTGREVAFDGIAIDLMQDGKRTDGWAQLDRLALLTQLGGVDPV